MATSGSGCQTSRELGIARGAERLVSERLRDRSAAYPHGDVAGPFSAGSLRTRGVVGALIVPERRGVEGLIVRDVVYRLAEWQQASHTRTSRAFADTFSGRTLRRPEEQPSHTTRPHILQWCFFWKRRWNSFPHIIIEHVGASASCCQRCLGKPTVVERGLRSEVSTIWPAETAAHNAGFESAIGFDRQAVGGRNGSLATLVQASVDPREMLGASNPLWDP